MRVFLFCLSFTFLFLWGGDNIHAATVQKQIDNQHRIHQGASFTYAAVFAPRTGTSRAPGSQDNNTKFHIRHDVYAHLQSVEQSDNSLEFTDFIPENAEYSCPVLSNTSPLSSSFVRSFLSFFISPNAP